MGNIEQAALEKSGRYVVGMWSVSGRYVVGKWSVSGRYVVGMWSVCGRYCRWTVGSR